MWWTLSCHNYNNDNVGLLKLESLNNPQSNQNKIVTVSWTSPFHDDKQSKIIIVSWTLFCHNDNQIEIIIIWWLKILVYWNWKSQQSNLSKRIILLWTLSYHNDNINDNVGLLKLESLNNPTKNNHHIMKVVFSWWDPN